ncbi:exodeoxyribonuclease III [Brevundimonas goettingensis]|uniref:Exodeoxyribonuclease III n=1 Tax=Brevundimonas goettingensis TaxID=2774190 RepID=A0A975GUL2_9CAUL|nr:exodeoxyribonuclease III [Brevundimonas goettingensis]QTC90282.1 exodeoxyribonuclease III [Brevundimonas goettingensis]
MRIATYNINGVNRRLENLLSWLEVVRPDVVCLQELKAETSAFPIEAIEAVGYGAVWQGQRSWNGVAILARGATPVLTRRALPSDRYDEQARYIEAAVNGILFASLYAPNGNPRPGPKFDYKLAWMKRLIDHAGGLVAAGVPVVLAGDYNIVPTDDDIYPGHREADNALLQPESRVTFERLLSQGWGDSLRAVYPQGPLWTFWGYLRHRWRDDKGMRLDHLLLSPSLQPRLAAAGVSREARAAEGASDHAPVWIELAPVRKAPAATSGPSRSRSTARSRGRKRPMTERARR